MDWIDTLVEQLEKQQKAILAQLEEHYDYLDLELNEGKVRIPTPCRIVHIERMYYPGKVRIFYEPL